MGIKPDVTTPRIGADTLPNPEEASAEELKTKAAELGIEGRSKMGRDELTEAIADVEGGPAAHR